MAQEGLTAANWIAIAAIVAPLILTTVSIVILAVWRLSRLLEHIRSDMVQLDNKVCIYAAQWRESDRREDRVMQEIHDKVDSLQESVAYLEGQLGGRRTHNQSRQDHDTYDAQNSD